MEGYSARSKRIRKRFQVVTIALELVIVVVTLGIAWLLASYYGWLSGEVAAVGLLGVGFYNLIMAIRGFILGD